MAEKSNCKLDGEAFLEKQSTVLKGRVDTPQSRAGSEEHLDKTSPQTPSPTNGEVAVDS